MSNWYDKNHNGIQFLKAVAVKEDPLSNYSRTSDDLLRWHGVEIVGISLFIFVGVVGNSLVIYVYQYVWSDTVTLIKRMLAWLDMATLCIGLPAFLYLCINQDSEIFDLLCKTQSFVIVTSSATSSIVLVMIAVDRFMVLVLLRTQGLNAKQTTHIFVSALILCSVMQLPSFWIFGKSTIKFEDYHVYSTVCFTSNATTSQMFDLWIMFNISLFLIVTVALFLIYRRLIMAVRSESIRRDSISTAPPRASINSQFQNQERVMVRTTLVFSIVTIIFFCSYVPYFILIILKMNYPRFGSSMGPALKSLNDLGKMCPLVNNWCNPIIYSFTSKRFRQVIAYKIGWRNRRPSEM